MVVHQILLFLLVFVALVGMTLAEMGNKDFSNLVHQLDIQPFFVVRNENKKQFYSKNFYDISGGLFAACSGDSELVIVERNKDTFQWNETKRVSLEQMRCRTVGLEEDFIVVGGETKTRVFSRSSETNEWPSSEDDSQPVILDTHFSSGKIVVHKDTILVGNWQGVSKEVHFFRKKQGKWLREEVKLNPQNSLLTSYHRIGYSIHVSGDGKYLVTDITGHSTNRNGDTGIAIFEKIQSDTWVERQVILTSQYPSIDTVSSLDRNKRSSLSRVTIDGDGSCIYGANWRPDKENAGGYDIVSFCRNATGLWALEPLNKIENPYTSINPIKFGIQHTLSKTANRSNQILFVNDPRYSGSSNDGRVRSYAFDKERNLHNLQAPQQNFEGSNLGRAFGMDLAASEDTLVVFELGGASELEESEVAKPGRFYFFSSKEVTPHVDVKLETLLCRDCTYVEAHHGKSTQFWDDIRKAIEIAVGVQGVVVANVYSGSVKIDADIPTKRREGWLKELNSIVASDVSKFQLDGTLELVGQSPPAPTPRQISTLEVLAIFFLVCGFISLVLNNAFSCFTPKRCGVKFCHLDFNTIQLISGSLIFPLIDTCSDIVFIVSVWNSQEQGFNEIKFLSLGVLLLFALINLCGVLWIIGRAKDEKDDEKWNSSTLRGWTVLFAPVTSLRLPLLCYKLPEVDRKMAWIFATGADLIEEFAQMLFAILVLSKSPQDVVAICSITIGLLNIYWTIWNAIEQARRMLVGGHQQDDSDSSFSIKVPLKQRVLLVQATAQNLLELLLNNPDLTTFHSQLEALMNNVDLLLDRVELEDEEAEHLEQLSEYLEQLGGKIDSLSKNINHLKHQEIQLLVLKRNHEVEILQLALGVEEALNALSKSKSQKTSSSMLQIPHIDQLDREYKEKLVRTKNPQILQQFPEQMSPSILHSLLEDLTTQVVSTMTQTNVSIPLSDLDLGTKREELGRGAFGVVYKGSWKTKPVAVKMVQLSEHNSKFSAKAVTEFYGELQRWKGLNHENVVKLQGTSFDQEKNLFAFVMERCEYSLKDLLYRKKDQIIDLNLLVTIGLGISRGVAYLHDNYIIHRDIKPANILLVRGSVAKLCDFGMSINKEGSTATKTVQNIVGTPAYIAPEACVDHPRISMKSDIFSIGVVLNEMIERRKPFEGVSQIAIIGQVVNGTRPHLTRPSKEFPEWILQLIEVCWQQERANRPTARDLVSCFISRSLNLGSSHPSFASSVLAQV